MTVLDCKAWDCCWIERVVGTNLSAPFGAGLYANIRTQLYILCSRARILLILRRFACTDAVAHVRNGVRATSQSRQDQSGILRRITASANALSMSGYRRDHCKCESSEEKGLLHWEIPFSAATRGPLAVNDRVSPPGMTPAFEMQGTGVQVYISSEDIGYAGVKSTILASNPSLSKHHLSTAYPLVSRAAVGSDPTVKSGFVVGASGRSRRL